MCFRSQRLEEGRVFVPVRLSWSQWGVSAHCLIQMACLCAAALIGTQQLFSSCQCFPTISVVPLMNIHLDISNTYSSSSDTLPCFCGHVFLPNACWQDQCQLHCVSVLSSLLYSQWEYFLLTLGSARPSNTSYEPDYKVSESETWFKENLNGVAYAQPFALFHPLFFGVKFCHCRCISWEQ